MYRYIKEAFIVAKWEILVSLLIYIIGIVLGIFWSMSVPLDEKIKDMQIHQPHYEAGAYISNNLTVCLLVVSGLITLGASTVLLIIYNGFILGDAIITSLHKFSGVEIAVRLIPHGLIELTGIVLSAAVGLQTLRLLIRSLRGEKVDFGSFLKVTVVLSVSTVLLIIVAGFIEAYITTLFI